MSAKESSPNPLQDHISFPTFDLVVNHFTSELNRCKEDLCGGVASAIPAADVINKLQGMCKISERDIYPTGMMGIDIPVLLQKGKEKPQEKIVVFIAQDPLRNASDANLHNMEYCSRIFHNDDIIVGTTFALHMKCKFRKLPFFENLVSTLWNNGYDVYMTDISKLYIQSLPINKLWKHNTFSNEAQQIIAEEKELLVQSGYKEIYFIISGLETGRYLFQNNKLSGTIHNYKYQVVPHITAAHAVDFRTYPLWNKRQKKVTSDTKIEFILKILRLKGSINAHCTSMVIKKNNHNIF